MWPARSHGENPRAEGLTPIYPHARRRQLGEARGCRNGAIHPVMHQSISISPHPCSVYARPGVRPRADGGDTTTYIIPRPRAVGGLPGLRLLCSRPTPFFRLRSLRFFVRHPSRPPALRLRFFAGIFSSLLFYTLSLYTLKSHTSYDNNALRPLAQVLLLSAGQVRRVLRVAARNRHRRLHRCRGVDRGLQAL